MPELESSCYTIVSWRTFENHDIPSNLSINCGDSAHYCDENAVNAIRKDMEVDLIIFIAG